MSELISREEHLVKQGKLPSETTCHRTYTVNVDYFKIWNHDMAYILGFTATDGCIRINNGIIRKPNGSIIKSKGIYQVTWSGTDMDVLEYIKNMIKCEHPIKVRPVSYYSKYNYKNVKEQWYLTISSKEIVTDLMTLGIGPKKSNITTLPSDYPVEYMNSYIRGVMDGDGCWALDIAHKKPHPRAFITSGSYDYLTRIGEYLKKEIGIIPKIYTNSRGVHNLSYGGKEVPALSYYITNLNDYFMIGRKKERMLEVIKGYKETKCTICGSKFIQVSTLQKVCKKCKVQEIVRPITKVIVNKSA